MCCKNNNLIFKTYTLVIAINNKETINYNIYNKDGMIAKDLLSFYKL